TCFFVFTLFLAVLITANSAQAQEKNASLLEIGYAITSPDNKTVRFISSYAENSTGIVTIIPNADCQIAFSDQTGSKKMNYNPNSNYDITRTFSESAKITYTVACTHQNYTEQTKTKTAEIITDFFEVVLISPQNNIATREINFICEVRGKKPDSISLYSDTSGEWKLRATSDITTSRPPFRVNFTEEYVSDGPYRWNCEANSGGETKFAPADKKFTVKFAPKIPDCFEAVDCSSWDPDPCQSGDTQSRKCNSTVECGYLESRDCLQPPSNPDSNITLIESPVLLPDNSGSNKLPKTDGGLGTLPLVLIIIIAGAVSILLLKFRKKRQKKGEEKEEDVFGDLDEELPEEETDDNERQEPGEQEK
ncbi:MAG TPA: hypothetical protein VJB06_01405, partial [archaeon]|nr:hypothetical protein [archaeon]